MDREVVKELIQDECNAKRIRTELQLLLPGQENRVIMLNDYDSLIEKLGGVGASKETAIRMLKTIEER
jgi:lipid-A-disaccharide synthase